MYVQGFILPVPAERKAEYRTFAQKTAAVMSEYGLIENIQAWEDDVPDGEHTDFRKAVKLEDGEKVVFTWLLWPDKSTCDGAHEQMASDPRVKEFGEQIPFDRKRMIVGGFEPIVRFSSFENKSKLEGA